MSVLIFVPQELIQEKLQLLMAMDSERGRQISPWDKRHESTIVNEVSNQDSLSAGSEQVWKRFSSVSGRTHCAIERMCECSVCLHRSRYIKQ